MVPHHWSKNPEENQTSDPNGYVQKNWPASAMGAAVRGLMATAACARDDNLGTLAATLGASNVYSVGTNEGLIDPATQINGLTPAITKPFVLRLAFDTALAGSATNIPRLKVDGFDCGPILRRDLTALVDGDLITKAPVWVLGDFAATTDTKITRVRVLDYTASDIKGLLPTVAATGSKITVPAAVNVVPSYARTKLTNFGAAADGTGGKAVWDAANSRLLPGAGSWLISARLKKDMPAGVNYSFFLDLCRNGAAQSEVKLSQTNSTITYAGTGGGDSAILQVAAGDYFEAFGNHNYGSSNPLPYWVELVAVYLGA